MKIKIQTCQIKISLYNYFCASTIQKEVPIVEVNNNVHKYVIQCPVKVFKLTQLHMYRSICALYT